MKPIPQSSDAMRFLCTLTVLFSALMTGFAQTNTSDYPVPSSETNAALTYAPQTNGAAYALPNYDLDVSNMPAMSITNVSAANLRQLSLQDCIQLALATNLDLQIDRFGPEVALFTLNGSYSYYDPVLALAGGHRHVDTGASFSSTTGGVAGSKTDDNETSGGLSGYLPSGLNYNLQASTINTFGTAGGTNNIPFDNGNASVLAKATQPLLKDFWIDTGRLTIRINKNRLKYSEQTLRLNLMQTITAVEKAYYDLIYNRENVEVQRKAVELAERLVMENEKKLEVGALAPLDLASAKAQAAQSRAAVFQALSQLGTLERTLKGLISDEYADWADLVLVPSGTLTATHQILNRQDSWGKGLTQRPEVIQARLDVEKQGIQLKFDRNQLYPQLDFVGSYGYNGSSTNNVPEALSQITDRIRPVYFYGGQFTIPLANTAARNTYKSDKMTLAQLLATLKKQEQGVMIAIDNDIGTVQADYDQVLATRAQRQYEEQALDAEQKKLENGKSTTYTVLQVQRDLTSARGAELQALDTFNKDLSQLSLDEGSTLERLGINLQAP
jgi:outer membrane protein TolC